MPHHLPLLTEGLSCVSQAVLQCSELLPVLDGLHAIFRLSSLSSLGLSSFHGHIFTPTGFSSVWPQVTKLPMLGLVFPSLVDLLRAAHRFHAATTLIFQLGFDVHRGDSTRSCFNGSHYLSFPLLKVWFVFRSHQNIQRYDQDVRKLFPTRRYIFQNSFTSIPVWSRACASTTTIYRL